MRRALAPVEMAELRLSFDGAEYVLSLIGMAAIEPRRLRSAVGSLVHEEDEIRSAGSSARALHRFLEAGATAGSALPQHQGAPGVAPPAPLQA